MPRCLLEAPVWRWLAMAAPDCIPRSAAFPKCRSRDLPSGAAHVNERHPWQEVVDKGDPHHQSIDIPTCPLSFPRPDLCVVDGQWVPTYSRPFLGLLLEVCSQGPPTMYLASTRPIHEGSRWGSGKLSWLGTKMPLCVELKLLGLATTHGSPIAPFR